jgi:NAD-dependent SIR2 family protein deacetylase
MTILLAQCCGDRKPMVDGGGSADMAECQNCGSHVTEVYVRVFTPDAIDNPRVCPNCEDKTRDRNGVRKKRT